MDPDGSAVRMGPNFARSAPKVGAVAKAIEVDFQGEGSWSAEAVFCQSSTDTSRSKFSHVQRTIQDCEVGSRDGCSWGVRSDVSQPLRRSAEDTCIGRGSASSRPHCKHGIFHYMRQEARGDRAQRCGDKAELAKAEAKLAFEEAELSKAEHRLEALEQEAKTVPVSTPFSVDPSRVPPDVEAEFKKMQEVIASLQQELSALRSGQGVPLTEPDSSEAAAIHLLCAQVARLEEEARGSGVRETKRRTLGVSSDMLALTNPSPMVA